jgi:AmmeMemoRadiSam system protein A
MGTVVPLPPDGLLGEADGATLASIAVGSVRARLVGEPLADGVPEAAALRSPGASFVTLERRGRLRGCVGTLRATRALYLDVIRNALRAMIDPRLPPVDKDDWPELDVKVSVLTVPTPVEARDRQALLATLRPGVDGLLLTDGSRRATFLPAVWQRLTEPADFVAALLLKGGWPAGDWPAGLTAHRYTAYEYHNPAPRNPITG